MRILLSFFLIFLTSCTVNPKKIEVNKPLLKLNEIIIGDINTQFTNTEYIQHYYMGINLAINEINEKGGVNGIPLKLKVADSYGSFVASYNSSDLLVKKYNVLLITGSLQPNIALSLQEYSTKNNIPFINTGSTSESIFSPDLASKNTFRFVEGINNHIDGIIDNMINVGNIENFSVVTYSNSEGDTILSKIKDKIKASSDKISIASVIRIPETLSFDNSIVESIYNIPSKNIMIALYGPDLKRFVNFIQTNHAVYHKNVYILFAGITEWLDTLGKNTPSGWVTTGYPWYNISSEENKAFYKKYTQKYKLKPRYSSYIGYSTYYLIYHALLKANIRYNDLENNRKSLINALEGLSINTPIGNITMLENHKTNLGTYVGILIPYNKKYKKDTKVYESLDIRMKDSYLFQEKNKNS